MKKVLIALMVMAVLVGAYTLGRGKGADEIMSHIYSRVGTVCAIDEVRNSVLVVDGVNFKWEFFGVEDWEVGDMVSMIMDDNGTDFIEDDIIIDVTFVGFPDWYEVVSNC